MKTLNKAALIIIGTILAILTFLVSLRFFNSEDVWLCEDGQWVRHGNPGTDMPSSQCE